ncbi:hypothetical protein [Polaromonas sp.]|uniref:hypothetical protein n=1 Tax=Polaromonas sp. TaxID=1869339 RepID=UPI003C837865
MQLLVQGDYLRIMDSTGAVEVITEGYRLGPIKAGQGQRNSPFTRVQIVDKSGAPNIGNVLIADSDFVDQRINGDVSVIDGGKNRTVAGGSYMGGGFSTAGVGVYAQLQLWNPAGTGKRLVVNQVQWGATSATAIFMKEASASIGGALLVIANKMTGGAAGVAQVRAATAGAAMAGYFDCAYVQASSQNVLEFSDPYVIAPGYGLTLQCSESNKEIGGVFEFFEELV